MGFFDRFKKKEEIIEEQRRLENSPEMLTMKLLFLEKPNIDTDRILAELNLYFTNVNNPGKENPLIFHFPDIKVELADAILPAQCLIAIQDETNSNLEIPEVAFQQNWHWQEANETATKCKYQVLVSDLVTRTLEYKQRLNLFMNFLVAVTKVIKPDVIYSVYAQKLINPEELVDKWSTNQKQALYGNTNVRLYNISNEKKELLMDTVGLHALGLPDFQIRFSDQSENEVASLLWNYAYYIYENGDVIENGNTLEGTVAGSKWKCERQASLLGPQRIVINVQTA